MTITCVSIILAFCAASVAYQNFLSKDATEEATKFCAEQNMVTGAYRICLDRMSLAGKAY